jgi:signal transduction histidine kinase
MTETQPILSPEILVPRLGEHLMSKGLITSEQLQLALQEQAALKKIHTNAPLLGEILVNMGFLTRAQLESAITEHVLQLRAALIDANQKLEQRVQQRTAELEKALLKLAELNQLKANFIANISHELRTPLTHIKGYQELLISGDLGQLTGEQMTAMSAIQRATQRLERLIEDLILYATSERTHMPVELARQELIKLCREVVEQSERKAADQKLELIFLHPDQPLPVIVDGEKLRWVLFQLVDNAIKFTPAGGKVQIDLALEDGDVLVRVSDTGIGISQNRIGEVFEAFHQLDGSSTRKYSGTGLGLSLVKKILDAHGTPIMVESELGKGSQFSFRLPLFFEGEETNESHE